MRLKSALRLALVVMLLVMVDAGRASAYVSCVGTLQCAGTDGRGNCVSGGGGGVAVKTEHCQPGTNSCNNRCSDGCPAINGNCEAIGGTCGPGLGTCPGTQVCLYNSVTMKYACSVGGGGGGGSCPPECRQGSSCGAGYSGASGCSGAGPGGGCKSNQVCCSANSCGGGGA